MPTGWLFQWTDQLFWHLSGTTLVQSGLFRSNYPIGEFSRPFYFLPGHLLFWSILILISTPNLGVVVGFTSTNIVLNICHVPSTPLASGDGKIKRSGCCHPQVWNLMRDRRDFKVMPQKETQSGLGSCGAGFSPVWVLGNGSSKRQRLDSVLKDMEYEAS